MDRPGEVASTAHGLQRLWRHVARAWKGYLAVLAVVAALFGGMDAARRIHGMLFPAELPAVHMAGDINVAITDFLGAASDGQEAGGVATAFAESMEQQLVHALSAPGDQPTVEVRGPADVGRLRGDSPAELAEAARGLAAELSAHVVVDGQLTTSDDGTALRLYLYIAPALLPNAEELVGSYELGQVAEVAGDVATDPVLRMELREEALGRVDALVTLITALAYYRQDNFEEAHGHLDRVAAHGGAALPDGGALLQLMQGNVALKSGRHVEAEAHYLDALDVAPGYGRAYVGLAETSFLTSNGDGTCSPGHVDAAGVEEAVERYRLARDAPVQPLVSDVASKTEFGLGRSLWCLSRSGLADHWDEAEDHYMNVIDEYESGNDRIRELAAESHAGLGLLLYTREAGSGADAEAACRAAIASYETAIDITNRRERRGVFTGIVAEIQGRLGDLDAAVASYERAATLDPGRADHYRSEQGEISERARADT
jgi:tetratricopeptide (TPR) repeat protein